MSVMTQLRNAMLLSQPVLLSFTSQLLEKQLPCAKGKFAFRWWHLKKSQSLRMTRNPLTFKLAITSVVPVTWVNQLSQAKTVFLNRWSANTCLTVKTCPLTFILTNKVCLFESAWSNATTVFLPTFLAQSLARLWPLKQLLFPLSQWCSFLWLKRRLHQLPYWRRQ